MAERPCESSHELPLLRTGGKQRNMRRSVAALAIAGACLVALLVVAAQPGAGSNAVVLEDTSQEAYHNKASRWSHDKVRTGEMNGSKQEGGNKSNKKLLFCCC
jgi:hypothetical protein